LLNNGLGTLVLTIIAMEKKKYHDCMTRKRGKRRSLNRFHGLVSLTLVLVCHLLEWMGAGP